MRIVREDLIKFFHRHRFSFILITVELVHFLYLNYSISRKTYPDRDHVLELAGYENKVFISYILSIDYNFA